MYLLIRLSVCDGDLTKPFVNVNRPHMIGDRLIKLLLVDSFRRFYDVELVSP